MVGETPSIFSTAFKYLFFFSVIAFLICLVLIILQMMGVPVFSFVAGDGGIITVPVPTTKQTAFTTAPISSDLSCNFVNVSPVQYTLSFDVFIKGDFITADVPRVLLYRSPYPVTLQTSDSFNTFGTLFGSSNIIVFADPLKNDLYVAILNSENKYVLSEPIQNVPLRAPFRITLMVSDLFLEIYMNGNLKLMMPYSGGIILSPNTSYFFGPPPIINGSIQIGNIQYWNTPLASKVIRMFAQESINNKLFHI
jgi:hypothetical protein